MHKAEGGRCPQESAPDGVALHPARVRRGLEDAARLAAGGAHAPERPGLGDDHVVPAASELLDRGSREARLDLDLSRPRLTRVEGAREVVRMEGGRIDRRLEVEPGEHVAEEEAELPLVLLVAARRAEGEVRLSVAEGERRD